MKRKDSQPLIRAKPNAMKQNISMLFETLGFLKQCQIRDGWQFLGNGAFKRKVI
jgi:hypothetical protein